MDLAVSRMVGDVDGLASDDDLVVVEARALRVTGGDGLADMMALSARRDDERDFHQKRLVAGFARLRTRPRCRFASSARRSMACRSRIASCIVRTLQFRHASMLSSSGPSCA